MLVLDLAGTNQSPANWQLREKKYNLLLQLSKMQEAEAVLRELLDINRCATQLLCHDNALKWFSYHML